MAQQAEAQGITQDEAEQAFLKAARPTSLIGRFAMTDEVANMIVYACSEQASATSGAALRVDGGVVLFVALRLEWGSDLVEAGGSDLRGGPFKALP